MARTKRWSYSTGERGRNRVRAFEHTHGLLFLEFSRKGKRTRVSLGHRDRERAKQEADEASAKLGKAEDLKPGEITLGELFERYLGEETPGKAPASQSFDLAATDRLLGVLGKNSRASTVDHSDWQRFKVQRSSGAVTGSPVGPRTVARDLKFLLTVLNWATSVRGPNGGFLLDSNPLRAEKLPREESPLRPMIPHWRYKRMLEVASQVGWRFEVALVVAHETGHRIAAVAALRWSDVDLERHRVRWRQQNDKIGKEHSTELLDEAVEALLLARAQHPGVGDAWVFPSHRDAGRHTSRFVFRTWWLRTEKLAGLDHVERMGWHSIRRKFTTELKHVPLVDLAELGGWKTTETILECYQQPDRETQRDALASRRHIGAESTHRIDTRGEKATGKGEPRSA